MSNTNEKTGIEALRYAVRLFNDTREDVFDSYTTTELLRIASAHQRSGWDIYPDQWSKRQLERAARYGEVPRFNERGEPLRTREEVDAERLRNLTAYTNDEIDGKWLCDQDALLCAETTAEAGAGAPA